VRKYIGENKDYWLSIELKQSKGQLPQEIGERPPGIIFDRNLDAMARKKAQFVSERKKVSGKLLADYEVGEDQLKEYIGLATHAFSQLQDEINLV